MSPPSQRIPSRNRGVYFLHMYSCGKINAIFDFSSLWNDLCDSAPQAWYSKRVVNFFRKVSL